jgi:hypothetical protein
MFFGLAGRRPRSGPGDVVVVPTAAAVAAAAAAKDKDKDKAGKVDKGKVVKPTHTLSIIVGAFLNLVGINRGEPMRLDVKISNLTEKSEMKYTPGGESLSLRSVCCSLAGVGPFSHFEDMCALMQRPLEYRRCDSTSRSPTSSSCT